MGSDDFFAHETSILEEGLDVVLIDGLHEYKQVLRDVNNCLKYLNDGGVIVLHDCNPVSEAMALRAFSLSEAKELAKENGLNWTKEWTGDVWKSVVSLRSFRDDLNVFVLDCDYGLGIITKKKPESSLNFSEEDIKKMGYEDLANNRKGLLCLKDSEFFEIFLSEL